MPAPAMAAATADGYAIALEEARRALDEQERAVAGLSARAGALLSAAAIATSFLGGTALARGEIGVASWTAIATFVAFCGTTLPLLRPHRDWSFAMWPSAFLQTFVEPLGMESAGPLRRDVALAMDATLRQNAAQLDRMVTTFHIASVLLTIEVLAWVVAIATTG
jgi:hypothetical protein